MLPVIENIKMQTGTTPTWLSFMYDSSAAQHDPTACQKVSEVFIAYSYEPSLEELQHFKIIINNKNNLEDLSFLLMLLTSDSSAISCAALSQILSLSAVLPQVKEFMKITSQSDSPDTFQERIRLCAEHPLKIDALTTFLKLHHVSTETCLSLLLLQVLFSSPVDELQSKSIFIGALLEKNVSATLSLFEQVCQYPETSTAKKVFDAYQEAFPSEDSFNAVLSEIFCREPANLLNNISEIFSSILAQKVIAVKPELESQQFSLERVFQSINYLNSKEASARIKQILFLLKSPYSITVEQISFIIFASNTGLARELLMELRSVKKIKITAAHAQSVIGRKDFDTLLVLVRFILKNNALLLNQQSFTKLIAYPDWEKVALTIKKLQRNSAIDIFWLGFPIILSTPPKSLQQTISDMLREREETVNRLMRHIILIPPPVRFIAETSLSQRHDYAHQETFNNGTLKTINNLKALYLEKISDTTHVASLKSSMAMWIQSLPSEQKFIAQRAFSSIKNFSGHEGPVYQASLSDCLLLIWCALNDQGQREDGIGDKEAFDYFLNTISDIKPGLCLDGHYKKLTESLICIHQQAVQSGPTLQILRNKFPLIVKNHAKTYLQSLDKNEAMRAYKDISENSLKVIWPFIRPLVHQSLLEEFSDLAPEGLDTPTITVLEQNVDYVTLSLPELEGCLSPKRARQYN